MKKIILAKEKYGVYSWGDCVGYTYFDGITSNKFVFQPHTNYKLKNRYFETIDEIVEWLENTFDNVILK